MALITIVEPIMDRALDPLGDHESPERISVSVLNLGANSANTAVLSSYVADMTNHNVYLVMPYKAPEFTQS